MPQIKEIMRYLGKALQYISLGMTLGCILTIGPIVAPSVFYNIERANAIGLMNIIFSKVTVMLLALLAVFLLGSVLKVLSAATPKRTKKSVVTFIFSIVFAAVSLYNLCAVTPKIAELVAEGHIKNMTAETPEFKTLHENSRRLFMGEAGLSLILILLLI